MSRELTKMNLIAIVQQLPKDDIEVIQTYISMIEQENNQLKEECEKQRYAIIENCDLRLEIEQLKEQLKDEEEQRIKIAKDRGQTYKECLSLIEQKKELRSWLEKDLLKYKTGFFTQDMGTTFKVSEHIKTIENVLSKLNELEGKNE